MTILLLLLAAAWGPLGEPVDHVAGYRHRGRRTCSPFTDCSAAKAIRRRWAGGSRCRRSLTNTVLVLGAAVLRQVPGVTSEVALSIGLMQGIPEAVVSAIIVVAVVSAVRQIGGKRGSRL